MVTSIYIDERNKYLFPSKTETDLSVLPFNEYEIFEATVISPPGDNSI